MKKFWKILLWILTGMYATFGFVFLVDGSGILCGLIAILFVITIIPINIWQSLINKYIKKVFKIIIAVTLAILFFVAAPTAELEDSVDNISPPSPTAVTITQATEPTTGEITDVTTEPVTEPMTTSPQIKETEALTEPSTTKPTEKPVTKPTEPTTKPTSRPTEPVTEASKPVSKPTEPPTKHSNDNSQSDSDCDYVVNTNTKKFHHPYCSSVNRINDENRWNYYGSRDELIDEGYEPCGKCDP